MEVIIPDEEVGATQALASRVFARLNVNPGPGQIFALEPQHHLQPESFFCLHWEKKGGIIKNASRTWIPLVLPTRKQVSMQCFYTYIIFCATRHQRKDLQGG